MLLLGQSGVSLLPPPPWCSRQSCLEPETSAPALPLSPPGKHRHLSEGCRQGVIHLMKDVIEQKAKSRCAGVKSFQFDRYSILETLSAATITVYTCSWCPHITKM